MEITAFSIEEIKDPTNIIVGQRYEFLLDVEFDEDDEIASEFGIEIRVIVGKHEGQVSLLNYFIIDKKDNSYLDFALEEEEEAVIIAFAKEQLFTTELEAE